MNKIVKISVLVIALLLILATGASAATNDTLADELYSIGSAYGLTSADKVRIERYLSEYPVTDSEADALVAYAEEMAAVFDAAGVTNYADLTADEQEELKTIANEAASLIDVTIVYKTESVDVYKDGKLVETVYETNGTLSYTGNTINIEVIVATIAVVALIGVATVVAVTRKRFANA